MKLLTQEIKAKLPAIYSTESTPYNERPIIVKFFCPWAEWRWYVLEGQEMPNGDYEFFGVVEDHYTEMGTFYLSQLEEIKGPIGLKIERDVSYQGVLSDLIKQED